MNRIVTAALLVAAAVLTNAAFTVLGTVFNYPDVLKEPTVDVLTAFTAHQGAVSFWFGIVGLWACLDWPLASLGAGYLASAQMVRQVGSGRHV